MNTITLKTIARAQTGRSASRRLRKINQIPAILYGKHTQPEKLAVAAPEFVQLLKKVAGRSLIIELERPTGESNALAFLQEVQRDPLTDRYLHVDFQEVKADDKFEVEVRVSITGEAHGVKIQNGVLEIAAHTVRVRCLPKDLPGAVVVDVTALKTGEAIKVANLTPIDGVEFRDPPGQPVVACLAVEQEAVVETTPGGAPVAGAAAKAAPAKAPVAKAPAAKAPAKK